MNFCNFHNFAKKAGGFASMKRSSTMRTPADDDADVDGGNKSSALEEERSNKEKENVAKEGNKVQL